MQEKESHIYAINCSKLFSMNLRIYEYLIDCEIWWVIFCNLTKCNFRLKQHYIDQAVTYYKLALEKNLTRGRKQSHNHAACVYITCRTASTERILCWHFFTLWMLFQSSFFDCKSFLLKKYIPLIQLLNRHVDWHQWCAANLCARTGSYVSEIHSGAVHQTAFDRWVSLRFYYA